MSIRAKLSLLLLLFLLILLSWPRLVSTYSLNLLAIHTLHVLHSPLLPPKSVGEGGSEGCRAAWFNGFLAQTQGDELTRDAAWQTSIRCDASYITFLHKMFPEDAAFAAYATEVRPSAAEGWFWRAEAMGGFANYNFTNVTDANRGEIAALLQEGLALTPHDGLRWRELGDVLRLVDPQAAIEAYLQSCFNGDPGSNGCWLAGHVAEGLGDIESAIRYYRFSHWQGALNRADELEKQLIP